MATIKVPMSLRAKREARWGWFFIMPWVIGFTVFTLGPMLASLYFSFTNFNLTNFGIDTSGAWRFPDIVGAKNFANLFFADPTISKDFYNSLKVTFLYSIMSLPLGLVAGFLLAYLLNMKIPGMNIWRTIFYLPSMLSGVVVALLWRGIFDPEYGVLNYLIGLLGFEGPRWLTDPNYTLFCFVFLALWGVGGGMIIYLAGLQSIQTSYYEAAELDGCTRWQQLIHITIPHMTPIIFFNLIMGVIGAFQFFAPAMVLTKGGPANSTMFYNLYLYKTAFEYREMGLASAQAWILFLIVLVFSLAIFKSSSMWVFYEGEVKKR